MRRRRELLYLQLPLRLSRGSLFPLVCISSLFGVFLLPTPVPLVIHDVRGMRRVPFRVSMAEPVGPTFHVSQHVHVQLAFPDRAVRPILTNVQQQLYRVPVVETGRVLTVSALILANAIKAGMGPLANLISTNA
jgi:hypothetical protein